MACLDDDWATFLNQGTFILSNEKKSAKNNINKVYSDSDKISQSMNNMNNAGSGTVSSTGSNGTASNGTASSGTANNDTPKSREVIVSLMLTPTTTQTTIYAPMMEQKMALKMVPKMGI
jgi:hypothetical protein